MNTKQKPLRVLLRLVADNGGYYFGSVIATVMIVLIGFAPPLLLA